jgi:hypothetical protein
VNSQRSRKAGEQALARKLAARSRRTRSGCLVWQGVSSAEGQGRVWWQGRYQSVGRLAFELAKGPVPRGAMVLHRCGCTLCIEPRHLFAGSQAVLSANIRRRKGERHPNHKLTDAKVRRIRRMEGLEREIANRFGVSRKTIRLIRQGKAWAHVR